MIMIQKPKFPLGQVVATPGALEAMQDAGQSAFELRRGFFSSKGS